MGRRQSAFKQTDMTRALKAAKKAGVRVKVEIEPGKLAVTMIGDANVEASEPLTADDELEVWRRGKRRDAYRA